MAAECAGAGPPSHVALCRSLGTLGPLQTAPAASRPGPTRGGVGARAGSREGCVAVQRRPYGVSEEERQPRMADIRLVRRLMGYVRPYRRLVWIAVLCNVAVAALGPLRPWLTQVAIDECIAVGDYRGLLLITMLLIGSVVVQAAILYGLTYLMQLVGQRVVHDLRVRLARHVYTLDVAYFDRTPVGETDTCVVFENQPVAGFIAVRVGAAGKERATLTAAEATAIAWSGSPEVGT